MISFTPGRPFNPSLPRTIALTTLYSNTFTSSFTGFSTFFGTFSTSASGLTATAPADAVFNTNFSTLATLSGDYTCNGGDNQLFINDDITFTSYVCFRFKSGLNLQLGPQGALVDSGIAAPLSGIHTFKLTKSGNVYTAFVDGVQKQQQTIAGHAGGYIGLQTTNTEFVTNFIATA